MKIFILTGAGISAESGLSTFRDSSGLWNNLRFEDVATPEAYSRNPGVVLDFYNDRRELARKAEPNNAHFALAKLQACNTHKIILVTQNVDDLHERAGTTKVIHMHGSLFGARCNACGQSWDASYDMEPEDCCPYCDECAVRPDVVWFGEAPKQMKLIQQALIKADLFVAIGTSGNVYPAADFVSVARENGAGSLILNIEAPKNKFQFQDSILGPASETVPKWVAGLIGED